MILKTPKKNMEFDSQFNNLLVKINIDYDKFFYRKYAYIDFSKILTVNNIRLFKKII